MENRMKHKLNLVELISARNFYNEKLKNLSETHVDKEFIHDHNDNLDHLRSIIKQFDRAINNYVDNNFVFD